MYQIVFKVTDPLATRGLAFHAGPSNELVSVSQELKGLGCPDTSFNAALDWVTFTHKVNFSLGSRQVTKMISRTQREMTLTLEMNNDRAL